MRQSVNVLALMKLAQQVNKLPKEERQKYIEIQKKKLFYGKEDPRKQFGRWWFMYNEDGTRKQEYQDCFTTD